jgi:hypothetical protein
MQAGAGDQEDVAVLIPGTETIGDTESPRTGSGSAGTASSGKAELPGTAGSSKEGAEDVPAGDFEVVGSSSSTSSSSSSSGATAKTADTGGDAAGRPWDP